MVFEHRVAAEVADDYPEFAQQPVDVVEKVLPDDFTFNGLSVTMAAGIAARKVYEWLNGKANNPETVLCPLTARAVRMMEESR